jgi:hypothetical protein
VETSVSKAFMAGALGVVFEEAYYLDPSVRRIVDARCHAHAAEALSDLEAVFTESNLGRKEHIRPDQVLVGGIQPCLILGMILGADFVPSPGGDADISPGCWADRPVGELPPPDQLVEHPIVRRFDAQVRAVQGEGSLTPVPPFFWDASGRAAIHGALTTAQKLFGEGFLADLLTEPDRARRAMDWITGAYITLVRHYAGLCGIRIQGVHVGECSSCMIGRDEWEAFVAPTLGRIGAELGPVRLHSCGPSDHILDALHGIPRLYSLDLGGESSAARVRELWGDAFPLSVAPPVKLLAAGDAGALRAWTADLLAANGRGDLVILYHIEPQYPLAALRAWCAWMKEVA